MISIRFGFSLREIIDFVKQTPPNGLREKLRRRLIVDLVSIRTGSKELGGVIKCLKQELRRCKETMPTPPFRFYICI